MGGTFFFFLITFIEVGHEQSNNPRGVLVGMCPSTGEQDLLRNLGEAAVLKVIFKLS